MIQHFSITQYRLSYFIELHNFGNYKRYEMKRLSVSVIGGGVIGISTAVNIIEKIPDIRVDIISEEFSPHTTSDIAGGIWDPHDIKDLSDTETLKLAEATFNYMTELSASEYAAKVGAFMLPCYKMSQNKLQPHIFRDIVYGYREMSSAELSNFKDVRFGVAFTTVLVECEKYLPWLTKRFVDRGGGRLKRKVCSMSELADTYDIVVNCTGLGARDLVNDEQVQPARGQMIRVHAPWIKQFVYDSNSFSYIIPRSDHVLLGGTYEEGNYNKAPDMDTRKRILAGCTKLMPSLKYAKFAGDLVGLRPCRSRLRLEIEEMETDQKKLWVVHNYGHSGSGVALHWGCAQKATGLVQEAVNRMRTESKL